MQRAYLPRLIRAGHEENLCAGIFQDVQHAFGGFAEIDRHDDGAQTGDGEVGGMPFGRIGRIKGHAVARAHA